MATGPAAAEDLVLAAADLLRRRYVFADKAIQAEAGLKALLATGRYEDLDGAALTTRLTADLYDLCHDHHLRLVWHDEPQPEVDGPADDYPDVLAGWRADEEADGHGIVRVERLEDGTGLIRLDSVCHAEWGSAAIGAAMTLVRHKPGARARPARQRRRLAAGPRRPWRNGAPRRLHAPQRRVRPGPRTPPASSVSASLAARPALPRPPRPRPGRRADVLRRRGHRLHAAGAGAGRRGRRDHPRRSAPHRRRPAPAPHVSMKVPTARSINPVTGTNWEGTGVVPDVQVPAEKALETALGLAADRLRGRA